MDEVNVGPQFKWGDRVTTPKGNEGKVIWTGKTKSGDDRVGVAFNRNARNFYHPSELTKKPRNAS